MAEVFDHGRKLTEKEYQRAIVELYTGLPPQPSPEQARLIRRGELDLAIDHRLGLDFPPERRKGLLAIQEATEKRRLWLAPLWLIRWVSTKFLIRRAQEFSGSLVDEYSKVLTPAELAAFFGVTPGERPQLPIDPAHLRK